MDLPGPRLLALTVTLALIQLSRSTTEISPCSCDNDNGDDRLEAVLSKLEEQNRQNQQIITHLSRLSQQLQEMVREEEEDRVCPAVNEIKTQLRDVSDHLSGKMDDVISKVCSGCDNTSTGAGSPCGSILNAASVPSTPDGWTMCYLNRSDSANVGRPCRELLQDMKSYTNAQAILSAGGNFGCWKSLHGVQGINAISACKDNYQHSTPLTSCRSCDVMAVCVRYPTEILTTTPTPYPSQVCGNNLEWVSPDDKLAPEGWVLCHLTDPGSVLRNTPCRDLLTGLVGYANAASLMEAGGNFGCWKSSTGVDGINPDRNCARNYQHSTTLASCGHCNTLGVCIYYPGGMVPTATTSTLTPTFTPSMSPSDCGNILRAVDPSIKVAPEGWVLCHLTSNESRLRETRCEDLLIGLRGYRNSDALLAAGGNFGCWKSSSGVSGININYVCDGDYQHTTTLSSCRHCDTLGVCIHYPRSTVTTTPTPTPTPSSGPSDCGNVLRAVDPSVNVAPEGWVLCHLTSDETGLRETRCEDLLIGLRGYPNADALLGAGGNFGCWKSSGGIPGINPSSTCRDNYQHTTTLSSCGHCGTMGVCIRYPINRACGNLLEAVPTSEKTPPESWTLCHLTDPSSELRETTCEDLLVALTGYANSQALLDAGGNFGCWKSSTGIAGINTSSNCKDNYQHTTTLNSCRHCNTLGVCIRYPPE